MSAYLYRAEAKGIQAWILGSDRLRELAGGSAIIDALPDAAAALTKVTGGTWISAAAGAVELEFEDLEALRRFAAVWPATVEALAPGLPLVQAWVPRRGTSSERRTALNAALGRARNQAAPALPEAGPWTARSGRTGLPAEGYADKKDGKSDGLVDAAVRRKLRVSAEDKRSGSPIDALCPEPWRFASDSDELGGGYVAVVHADGNGVGQRVMALGDAAAVRAFSDGLTQSTREAARKAFEALGRWVGEDTKRSGGTLRARPVVLGGDDLTVIVAAEWALPFTVAFLGAFEAATRARPAIAGSNGLTSCAGLVFVKAGFPFHAAHALAESLCKGAKRGLKPKDTQEPAASGLLFHRVTTASPELDWSDLRRGELAARDWDGKEAVLAGGPYPLHGQAGITGLASLVDALDGLPRGSLREWLRLAAEDPNRAGAAWQRMREVAGTDALARFDAALGGLGHDPNTGWTRGDPKRTALLDAALWARLEPNHTTRNARTSCE